MSSAAGKSVETKSQGLEWAKVVLLPLVTVLISVVGGYYFTNLTKTRDAREGNDRLYAQLLMQREQSDAQIRKDMFQVVMNSFLGTSKTKDEKRDEKKDLSEKVLEVELLANNFNQSLDLAPLFKDLARQLTPSAGVRDAQSAQLRKRLDLTAANVIFKQVNSLSRRGFEKEQQLPLAGWEKSFGKPFIDETIPKESLVSSTDSGSAGEKNTIRFTVEVIDVNIDRREVEIRLRVDFSGKGDQDIDRHFWVGQYDFPMLDNTQLPFGLRTSVVITDFFVPDTEQDREANSFVKFHLVVFPAASASFKERQDYDDILRDMLRAESRRTAQGSAQQGRQP